MNTILLIEREPSERAAFIRAVGDDERVIASATLDEAWPSLAEADLVVVGLAQSEDTDLAVLDRIHAFRPDLPVVITAPATLHGWQMLRSGMRLGAREFLTKPFDPDEVRQTALLATQRAQPEPSYSS